MLAWSSGDKGDSTAYAVGIGASALGYSFQNFPTVPTELRATVVNIVMRSPSSAGDLLTKQWKKPVCPYATPFHIETNLRP